MSKKRSAASPAEVASDKAVLLEAGYLIVEKSPYHWHVKHPKIWRIVNVWPTAKKYMVADGSHAQRYVDVLKAVAGFFKMVEDNDTQETTVSIQRPEGQKRRYTRKEQHEAQVELDKYRADPLGYIKSKTKK